MLSKQATPTQRRQGVCSKLPNLWRQSRACVNSLLPPINFEHPLPLTQCGEFIFGVRPSDDSQKASFFVARFIRVRSSNHWTFSPPLIVAFFLTGRRQANSRLLRPYNSLKPLGIALRRYSNVASCMTNLATRSPVLALLDECPFAY